MSFHILLPSPCLLEVCRRALRLCNRHKSVLVSLLVRSYVKLRVLLPNSASPDVRSVINYRSKYPTWLSFGVIIGQCFHCTVEISHWHRSSAVGLVSTFPGVRSVPPPFARVPTLIEWIAGLTVSRPRSVPSRIFLPASRQRFTSSELPLLESMTSTLNDDPPGSYPSSRV